MQRTEQRDVGALFGNKKFEGKSAPTDPGNRHSCSVLSWVFVTVNPILFVDQCLNTRNDRKNSDMSLELRIADKNDCRTLVLKECDTSNETKRNQLGTPTILLMKLKPAFCQENEDKVLI